jgi:hypothetical protein
LTTHAIELLAHPESLAVIEDEQELDDYEPSAHQPRRRTRA